MSLSLSLEICWTRSYSVRTPSVCGLVLFRQAYWLHKKMNMTMAAIPMQLIVDSPADRSRRSRRRSVHFADTSVMCIAVVFDTSLVQQNRLFSHEEDNKEFILEVRAMASAGIPVSYSGGDGSSERPD